MTEAALILISTSFPAAGDGSEAAGSFVSDLVDELALHLPVRVVAPGPADAVEWRSERIAIHRYAAPERPLSTLKPWRPSDLRWIWKVLGGGQRAVDAAVAAGPSKQILALWALPSGLWARRAARRSGLPYAVWTLGSDIWSLGRIPLVRSVLRRVLRDADACYSDGLKLAEDTRQIADRPVAFLPSTRKITLRNPPPPRSQPPYRLLFLGRWHPNKGIDLLLEALAMLTDADWQRIEAVEIQGGGPMEGLVRERVASLQAAGRPVELGGYLAKPEAEAAIVRADWVLIPSRIESIPLVLSDALKAARPVVVTDVGDMGQLVARSPASGVVAAAAKPQAIADVIAKAVMIGTSGFSEGVHGLAATFNLDRISEHLGQAIMPIRSQ